MLSTSSFCSARSNAGGVQATNRLKSSSREHNRSDVIGTSVGLPAWVHSEGRAGRCRSLPTTQPDARIPYAPLDSADRSAITDTRAQRTAKQRSKDMIVG